MKSMYNILSNIILGTFSLITVSNFIEIFYLHRSNVALVLGFNFLPTSGITFQSFHV